jgi:hypothetical protein
MHAMLGLMLMLLDDGDADQLSHTIGSLRLRVSMTAKSGRGHGQRPRCDRRLEDMLSDLESAYWPEMPFSFK